MNPRPLTTLWAILGLLGGVTAAWGQQQTSGSTQSSFGNRTIGSSVSQGTRTMFGGGLSGSGTGSQGGFRLGSGQGPYGQTGIPTTVGGQARQAGDFVGANAQQAGRNFVGATQAGSTGTGQGLGAAQGMAGAVGAGAVRPGLLPGGAGQRRPGQAGTGFGAGMMGAQGASTAPPIRARLSLGFDSPKVDSQKISSSLAQRLVEAPALRWHTPAQVEIQGRTAILRGVVATQHDRDLAERVVRLEATVEQVQNLLVVAGPGPSGSGKPDSSSAVPAGPALSPPAPMDSAKGPATRTEPAKPAPAHSPAVQQPAAK